MDHPQLGTKGNANISETMCKKFFNMLHYFHTIYFYIPLRQMFPVLAPEIERLWVRRSQALHGGRGLGLSPNLLVADPNGGGD